MFWIVFFIALVGAVLNVLGKRVCFLVWFISNGSWMVKNWMEGDIPQAATYAVFVVVSVIGWFVWKSKNVTPSILPDFASLNKEKAPVYENHYEMKFSPEQMKRLYEDMKKAHTGPIEDIKILSGGQFAEKIKGQMEDGGKQRAESELKNSGDLPAGDVPGPEAAR